MKALTKRWKVYNELLRTSMGIIIEIQTEDGSPVIPWPGFDDLNVGTPAQRLKIARHIVKAHNDSLKITTPNG